MVRQVAASLVAGLLTLWLWTYGILTLPFYFLLQSLLQEKRVFKRKIRIVSRGSKEIVWDSESSPSELHKIVLQENLRTFNDVVSYFRKRNEDRPFLGTRTVLAEEEERQSSGKIFKKCVLGEYSWLGLRDGLRLMDDLAAGMRELGLGPGDRMAIFSDTRAEWLLTTLAAFTEKLTVATLYSTLVSDAVACAINETEVSCVVTSVSLLPKLLQLRRKIPQVTLVICFEDSLRKVTADERSSDPSLRVLTYEEVLRAGGASQRAWPPAPPASPDDVAIVMYTSGSTGAPKGVQITHGNLMASVTSFQDVLSWENDVYIGYLPLAHILELSAELFCFFKGTPIGYSSAQTLMYGAARLKKGVPGDINVLKPTVMASVPLILDRIYKKVVQDLRARGPLTDAVFRAALGYKSRWLRLGFCTPLLDALLFSKVRDTLGGRVHVIICGGAALSREVQDFVRCVFCPVLQGYGLTEVTAAGTCMTLEDTQLNVVGFPVEGCRIKLIDWEEGNYRVSDLPNPRGEVALSSPMVTRGYFRNSELTAESFVDEGGVRWFLTGDVGELLPDGQLAIIDRKKDLVKLLHGEYISLGRIETELAKSPYVNCICVCALPHSEHTVALVAPEVRALKSLAARLGKETSSLDSLCEDEDIKAEVMRDLQELGRKALLAKVEMPQKITICHEKWTTESGLVTAALKLRRKNILEKYREDIERMYRGG